MQIVKKRKRLQEKCWKKAGMSALFYYWKMCTKTCNEFCEKCYCYSKKKMV